MCTHLRHKARGCSGSCSADPSEATSARGQASSIMTAATSSRMGKSVSVMTATCGDRARSRAGLSSGLLAPPRHPPPADAAAQSLLQLPRGRLGSGCSPGRRRSAHSQHPQQAAPPPSPLLSAPSSPCTQGCFHGATGTELAGLGSDHKEDGDSGTLQPQEVTDGMGAQQGGRGVSRATGLVRWMRGKQARAPWGGQALRTRGTHGGRAAVAEAPALLQAVMFWLHTGGGGHSGTACL